MNDSKRARPWTARGYRPHPLLRKRALRIGLSAAALAAVSLCRAETFHEPTAMGQYETGYPPALSISVVETDLILRYFLDYNGSFSIYQSEQLPDRAEPGRPWYVGPAAPWSEGEFALTNSGHNGAVFFYLVKNTNAIPSRMVWISPGDFQMGSPTNEMGRELDESPQRWVAIERGFWLGRFEVTQAEYQEVVGVNPSKFYYDPACPVESLRWEDATNYCGRLTERERLAGHLPDGYVYRLPTEAEWEYACRAGTQTRYSYGDDPDYEELDEYGWRASNGNSITHEVGQKRPNPWGLYDMHGNVFEWCLDVYGPYPGGESLTGAPKPTGSHVYRGGSWYCPPAVLRSASRHGIAPQTASFVGFRAALAPANPPPQTSR